MLKYGAYDSKSNVYEKIKNADFVGKAKDDHENEIEIDGKPLDRYEEIEIKLRIAKLLGIFDLSCYDNRKFKSLKELEEEARKNLERHSEGKYEKSVKVRGGIVFNPRPED